jgi:hypothetical protein
MSVGDVLANLNRIAEKQGARFCDSGAEQATAQRNTLSSISAQAARSLHTAAFSLDKPIFGFL